MRRLPKLLFTVASRFLDRGPSSERDPSDHVGRQRASDVPVPVRSQPVDRSDARTLTFLYEDARRVIDHQIAYLSDVDDKAVWTVRIDAVVIGAVLSAHQLSSRASLTDPIPGIALLAFLSSMVAGIVTYTASDAQFGPGPRYIDTVLDVPATDSHWRRETLRSYADWIEDNEYVGRRNGAYLLVSQILLLVGLATLTTGIAIELLGGVRW